MNVIDPMTAEHADHDQITWSKTPCQERKWGKMREKQPRPAMRFPPGLRGNFALFFWFVTQGLCLVFGNECIEAVAQIILAAAEHPDKVTSCREEGQAHRTKLLMTIQEKRPPFSIRVCLSPETTRKFYPTSPGESVPRVLSSPAGQASVGTHGPSVPDSAD